MKLCSRRRQLTRVEVEAVTAGDVIEVQFPEEEPGFWCVVGTESFGRAPVVVPSERRGPLRVVPRGAHVWMH